MPCPCPTNTLRLFIRSVAQVELPSSTIRTLHTQWQKTAIRSFASTRQQRAPSEQYNALSISKSHIPFEGLPPDTPKPQYGSQKWAQGVVDGSIALHNEKTSSTQPTDDVQAEGESTAGNTEFSSRVLSRKLRKERRRNRPTEAQQHDQAEGADNSIETKASSNASTTKGRNDPGGKGFAVDIKPTIRVIGEKNKVYDSGFKIHYSSPPAPASARPSKPETEPKLKPFDVVKEKKKYDQGDEWIPPTREHWQIDKEALKTKFPEGWKPMRRLSPDALAGIRALHAQDPAQYTTAVLANSFEVSAEAMRRILKSKWSPNAEEESDRLRRWNNRGKSVYSRYVELGVLKPPRKWRDMGIGKGKPEWLVKRGEERRRMAEKEVMPLPALVKIGRAKDEKYGSGARREKRGRPPSPALVTTRRIEPAVPREESLEDRIL